MKNVSEIPTLKDKIKIQLSKNGILISNLITNILLIKNLKSHYKFCQLNGENKLLGTNNNINPYMCLVNLLNEQPHLLNKTAIIQDVGLTYKQLLESINNLANYLHLIDSKKGEKISICAKSSINGIIAFFAMNKLGLVNARVFNGSKETKMMNNILNYNSQTIFIDQDNIETLNNILSCTNIKNIILLSSINKQLIEQIKKEHPTVNISSWCDAQVLGSNSTEYQEQTTPDDLAAILYTSGSSGEPKPISISNRVYSNMVEIVSKTTSVTKGEAENVVGVVSHEYPYAAINSTIMILLLGKTLIMPENTDENKINFNNLFQKQPNRIQAIPNFYKMLETDKRNNQLKIDDLSFLKYVISGGETYLKSEKVELLTVLNNMKASPLLIDGFGFGEMGSAAALKFGLSDYFLLMNGIEAKTIDSTTRKDLPIGTEGVLCFSGPTMADGYYNNDEATQQSFCMDGQGKKWFISDTYGSVHGKLKRLVKIGGRVREYFITGDSHGNFVKVYAGNVENVIMSSGYVKDCVVVPSDLTAMPTPIAYLTLKKDNSLTEKEILEIIKKYCETLESFAQPTQLKLEDHIERTEAEKKDYVYYKKKQIETLIK